MVELVIVELKDGTSACHEVPDNSRVIEGLPRFNGRSLFFPGLPEHAGHSDMSPKGTVCYISPGNAVYFFYPNGRRTQSYPNGTFYSYNADGSVRKSLPDGSVYDRRPDGIIRKEHDGAIIEKAPGRPMGRGRLPADNGPPAAIRSPIVA